MSRSYPLQSSLRGKLEQDFIRFRDKERLSDAEATRQLLTLALRIRLNESEDDRPSNRELMEETYRRIRQIQGIANLTYTQGFDGAAIYRNKVDATEMRNSLTADINNKVDAYLAGEKKE
ncbi:hypothetical protein ACQ902_003916 [Vibrio mimicus]|uniref:hypothetical protein n=1 Tax=Vibrio mimicus TaxID=674 RepID=UPI0011DA2216|nr:hypothetical protein [Vibrio mimicus]TXY45050.1 hypothetical protein FXE78_17320 [Vibrio mimicus]